MTKPNIRIIILLTVLLFAAGVASPHAASPSAPRKGGALASSKPANTQTQASSANTVQNGLSSTNNSDSKLVTGIISAIISATVSLLVFFLSGLRQKKQEKKNIILQVLYKYNALFSLIYLGSLDIDKVDKIALRNELSESPAIVFLLPEKTREHFQELYKIHYTSPEYYTMEFYRTEEIFKRIVQDISEFTDDFFGKIQKQA